MNSFIEDLIGMALGFLMGFMVCAELFIEVPAS